MKIESVQRRATKQVPQLKNMTYEERLKALKLPTLAYRRLRGDIIEVFKMVTGRYDTEVSQLLTLHRTTGSSVTRGHSLKVTKPRCSTDLAKFFFNRRVADVWNRLPDDVVTAPSIISFESRLDNQLSRLMIKYNFDLALQQDDPLSATLGIIQTSIIESK